jgi:hypothetical protein
VTKHQIERRKIPQKPDENQKNGWILGGKMSLPLKRCLAQVCLCPSLIEVDLVLVLMI